MGLDGELAERETQARQSGRSVRAASRPSRTSRRSSLLASGGTPLPWSCTATRTRPVRRWRWRCADGLPAGVCLMPLLTRFSHDSADERAVAASPPRPPRFDVDVSLAIHALPATRARRRAIWVRSHTARSTGICPPRAGSRRAGRSAIRLSASADCDRCPQVLAARLR